MIEVEFQVVNLSEIQVGEHDVRTVEEDPDLVGLANSIAREGLINPLTVERRADGLHLIAGHRRYAACVIARKCQVPVTIRPEGMAVSRAASFAENFHRRDLSPFEQALEIYDVVNSDTMSIEEVASVFHRSQEWVRDQVAMLAWPEDVLQVLQRRQLSVSAAANLARIEDAEYRVFLMSTAVDNGATAATTAIWLQGWRASRPMAAVAGEVAVPAPSGAPAAVPMCLCMYCRQETRPDGLVTLFVCPACAAVVRRSAGQGH